MKNGFLFRADLHVNGLFAVSAGWLLKPRRIPTFVCQGEDCGIGRSEAHQLTIGRLALAIKFRP
jgi:hypothetical protein